MTIILFDTETTGLLKPEAASLDDQPYIIEFFGTKIDKEFNHLSDLHFRCKPPMPIEDIITKITGITNQQLENKEPFEKSYKELCDFFVGAEILVAHNLPFDRGMLANELRRIERQYMFPWPPRQVCTIEATMGIQQRRMSLANVHKHLFGHEHTDQHSAKGDVYALVRVFHQLTEKGIVKI